MKIHRSRIRSVCALAGFMVAGLAHAGPEGAAVQRGNVTITQTSPTNWEIHASDGSVIHYTGFDIQQTEWVKFIQDNADSRVLNRVFSQNPTEILGRLSANGHVYLVNPAGIFIGPNAQIDANGFHAAAGHISDQDFLAHTEHYTDLKGAVTNLGVISGADVTLSDDGASVVALAGRQVTNGALGSLLGRIYVDGEQGWIVMAAGTDVLITSPSDRFAVQIEGALAAPGELKPGELPLQLTNYGTLQANRGSVGLAAGDTAGIALFQNGTHRVQGSQILVQGGPDAQVDVAGTLDASSASGAGGKIDISGTHV
ncbi:MAG TPA: filamentous hemagglutinin N-terminal domain-containing protein, partial [Myxococcota bacterium]|nr:filamentous hemagglutinin N-terminal domain-containing protein [Myxococcota bacterium]